MAVLLVVYLVTTIALLVSAELPGVTYLEIAKLNSGGSRIVSGWEAEEGQIPYQLSLRMVNPSGTVSSCGGSIIHPEWGLTAAHCTALHVTIVVRAGAVNLTRPEILFETTEYYNHPSYVDALSIFVQQNDISLLKFGRSLIFSERVQPIRLQRSAVKDWNYQGTRMIASGWGRTWTNGDAPENLQWVYQLGVSNSDCALTFSSLVHNTTICAGHYNVTSQSICQGDSGSPLTVIDDDGLISQVGIAAFVLVDGCHTDSPAGFVRPGYYHDWFYEATGINFDWELETTNISDVVHG